MTHQLQSVTKNMLEKAHPVPINISVYAKDYNGYEQIILQNLLIHSKSYVLNVLKYKR